MKIFLLNFAQIFKQQITQEYVVEQTKWIDKNTRNFEVFKNTLLW